MFRNQLPKFQYKKEKVIVQNTPKEPSSTLTWNSKSIHITKNYKRGFVKLFLKSKLQMQVKKAFKLGVKTAAFIDKKNDKINKEYRGTLCAK